ncbi:DUF3482 domain-containing protein [Neisseria leonii]|uniref:DUF3482 domain-containing protein n=1 Tax=Neisseria leonii TaxID=2995413 RepID=A0A9X4E156_9NEIS|nr:DUF3482 domain-containing protein [Neisseria sp. 51.81]MDD9327607.1 DUF3482 domain-containing protein [Neisseria sp. 51.81]
MMKPLALAVVGHTNTGKTSLMRTLLRDSGFGEVKNAAATTRHVERAVIGDGGTVLVELYDTPGLEDAGGVLDWLEAHTSARLDGVERIMQFLDSEAAAGDFNQEAKVLRQMLHSDTALYVVDAREPVLEKYKDELTVLSWCAKPVMPVFNFTGGRDLRDWTEMLARRLLHVYSGFDTVAFDFEGEMRLWDNLATMLPDRSLTDRLMAARRRDWAELNREARRDIAHFLLDVAAYKQEIDAQEHAEPVLQQMQQAVREAERALQQQLFRHYRFYRQDIDNGEWVLKAFRQDPFDGELLKQYGIRTGKGAAAGALIGMGVDMAALGGTLGLGTALGSMIGGVLPNMQQIGGKLSGRQTLHIDPDTIRLLAARAMDLLDALQKRGHAAQTPVSIISGRAPWADKRLPPQIGEARGRAKWSALNTGDAEYSRRARQAAAEELAEKLP